MKFNLENTDRYTVISYQPGEITILLGMETSSADERPKPRKQTLSSSFILAPDQLVEGWPVDSINDLSEVHLKQIIDLEPELVLLGSGATHCFPDTSLLVPFHKAQIGYEIMDSQAACRTYNLLRGEGRHVVAGIIL